MNQTAVFRMTSQRQSRSLLSIGDHTPNQLLGGGSESGNCHLFLEDCVLIRALLRLTVAAQPPPDTGGMDVSMMIHSIRPGCYTTGDFPEAGAFTPTGAGVNS
jgi:hypothetical protein